MTLCLLVQFVGEIGKEGLQAGKKGIVVSRTKFLYKLADVKSLVTVSHSGVKWNSDQGFYGVLKSADRYLRFVFLTGVTKFSQVSVFSDLNQLQDG